MAFTKKNIIITTVVICICVTALVLGLVLGLTGNGSIQYDDSTPKSLSVSSSLVSYSSVMLDGYDQCTNFVSDLEEMSKHMANVHIDRMALQYYHSQYFNGTPRGGDFRLFGEPIMEATSMVDEAADSSTGTNTGTSTGEDSYGTNNQVEGVDEADTVKSDGTYVYAAYGDKIVVWDATSGIEVSRTVIPTADDNGTPLCEKSSRPTDFCYENYNWQKMTVKSLLMSGDRITAIVESPFDIRTQDTSTMYGSRATRLFVFDKTIYDDKRPLALIAQKDINGYYQSGRLIDQNVHVVTSSTINAWSNLYEHLNPPNFVEERKRRSLSYYYADYGKITDEMTENEYRNAAYAKAEELIPSFAQQLAFDSLDSTELSSNECSKIVRLAFYSKTYDNSDDISTLTSFTTASALSNFAQVTSFDILAAGTNGELSTSKSGIFVPFNSYSNSVYSSRDKLIIAGEGYQENSNGVWEEQTILFAFGLNQSKSIAESIGVVPGSLLNQFSMDHYRYSDEGPDYLRVATTSWGSWGLRNDIWTETELSSSQVTVLELPSSSDSQTDTAASMQIVGQASDLGKGERIYAVRFLGTRAFVVTFRRIDPFYTLNMENPENPQVIGELKIPGFSNYLHPIGDGNLILAIGQDAEEEFGVTTGLQVAMYNVTDFANPTQVKKFSEKDDSSSSAEYDHKAFRYLPETELLILPVKKYDYEAPFDGFTVYNVPIDPEKKFEISFKISHVNENMNSCWSDSYLSERSLVFNGYLTTMKGHTIMSHALSTKEQEWLLNLDVNREKNANDYCNYWMY